MSPMLSGLVANRYEIEELVGNGGMAEVYRARDTRLHRPVALKLIADSLARNPEFLKRFENEARVLATLENEYIVQVFDYGDIDTRPFLAMQYVDGRSLAERIRSERTLTPYETTILIGQIASALDYAHDRGVLHRDVKPANIMLWKSGKATLTDFGVAKALINARRTEAATAVETAAATTIGTVAYMSPEQIQSAPLDGRADVYSLGVVAYEALTARLPFAADSTIGMLHKVIHEPPQPLDLPREERSLATRINDTIRRALCKSPRHRFATAAEFALALSAAVGDPARTVVNLSPPTSNPPPTPSPEPASPTSTPQHVALATRLTPALAIYLLDLSGSMGLPLGGRTRIDLVKEALTKTIERMVFRSTRGVLVSPRYRVAVLGYSDRVYDLLSGIKSVDRLAAESFDPGLVPLSTTDTARGFAEVEKLLAAELSRLQDCPAPIVCHLTDGESTGDDPEPIVERIKAMKVADGNVLVENVFISEQVLSGPMADVMQWSGVTRNTPLATPYADKLRRMSSPLPDSYRSGLNDFGFNLGSDAVMMLPGTSPELVKLAFQMSGMTGVAAA
jgi:serine/threonine protein kinase